MKSVLFILSLCYFLVLASSQYQSLLQTCGPFNTYDARLGYALPEGYTDLTNTFPGLYLDEEGRITLPCNLSTTVGSTNNNIPIILSASASVFGTPICVLAVDCPDTGRGSITLNARNNRNNQSVSFTAEEICSQPGVFFGCVDTAYSSATNATTTSYDEPTISGQFGDQITLSYSSVNTPAQSNNYQVYVSCSYSADGYAYQQVSSLLIQDAVNRTMAKLAALRRRIVLAGELLFSNAEGIPCEEIGQAADLSQTALEFFNFLECLGNREAAEASFNNRFAALKPRELGAESYCSLQGNGTTSVKS